MSAAAECVRSPRAPPFPAGYASSSLRGLARQPTERWPAMNALLAELERQPAVASRRRFATAAAAKLAGIWEPPRGEIARRHARQVRDAASLPGHRQGLRGEGLAGGGRDPGPLYAALVRSLHRGLRGHARARRAVRRGARPSDGLPARRAAPICTPWCACSAIRRRRWWRTPSRPRTALGTLERCENVELLRSLVRPPPDSATRQVVDRLRAQLAEVRALASRGPVQRCGGHDGAAGARRHASSGICRCSPRC